MVSVFTRIAAVQLAYHPAIVLHMRSPLEDPGGVTALVPVNVPYPLVTHLEELRRRIRAAYSAHLLRRAQSIIKSCRDWGVRVVVFPEYSIPWDVLADVAKAAGDLVVVAGTHMVELAGLDAGIYERLGCPRAALPGLRQAVAPVLHDGKLLALSPKFHAATAVGEDIEPGSKWAPVDMPEGIVGPMGVMVCLDFLYRENDEHRMLVAEPLEQCRFLAIPSLTRKPSVSEFAARAWEEAKRYGRPVLYTNHADGGGTSIFVDEEKHSDLRPFPEHVGCLEPRDEGVIVADVDLGHLRPGGSTRYDAARAVRPFAAATLLYRARPEGDEYASWLDEVAPLFDGNDVSTLRDLVARVQDGREILQNAGRLPGAAACRERLERLTRGLRLVTRVEEIRQLTCEVVLPADVLPFDALCATLARGAAEAMQSWLVDHPELGDTVKGLRDAGKEASGGTWTGEGRAAIEAMVREVRGQPEQRTALREAFRGRLREALELIGRDPIAHNGFALSFRAQARDFEFKLATNVLSAMSPVGASPVAGLPRRGVAPSGTPMDTFSSDINQARVRGAEAVFELLVAEGASRLMAVGVRSVVFMGGGSVIRSKGRSVDFKPTVVVACFGEQGWVLSALSHDRDWITKDRAALLDTFDLCGIAIATVEFIDNDEFLHRRARLLQQFEGARAVLREFLRQRLAEVGGHFVEPDIEVGGAVRTGLSALDDWLGLRRTREFGDARVAIVLGEYGSGKSTLLAWWADHMGGQVGAPIPLFVSLASRFVKAPEALLLDAADLPDSLSNRAALRLLINGGLLLPMFDGFDEMATHVAISELPEKLAGLLATADLGGKVLLSSRDHYFPTENDLHTALDRALTAELGGPSNAQRFCLRPLTDTHVRSLVRSVAGTEAAAVLARIQTTYDLNELVHRPLLLGMVLSSLQELPREGKIERIDIYEACFKRWLAQTGEFEVFSPEQKRDFAETVAKELWRSGEPSCSLTTLRRELQKFPPGIFDDLPRTAEVLETTGGMFFVRAPGESGDRYRFAHKSFLEYFLARSLVRALGDECADVEAVLSTKRLTPEVVAFVGEILSCDGNPKQTAAVRSVQRWLIRGRRAWESNDPELLRTADAAANALRLLLELGRWSEEPEGWLPEGADLRAVQMVREDLQGVRLVAARLEDALLAGADLSGADLTRARLDRARLSGATLHRATLTGASARGTDFLQVGADRADLTGADLSKAVLRQSMWTKCVWDGAKVEQNDITAWAAPGSLKIDWPLQPIAIRASQTTVEVSTGHGGAVMDLSWSSDGTTCATTGYDGSVRIWRYPAMLEEMSLRPTGSMVRCVAWRSSTSQVAVAGDPGLIVVFDAVTGCNVTTVRVQKEHQLSAIAWHPKQPFLLVGCASGAIVVVDFTTLEKTKITRAHRNGVESIAWNQDGTLLASAGNDGFIKIWNASTLKMTVRVGKHFGRATSVSWNRDGTLLASAGADGTIRLWSTKNRGDEVARIAAHERGVRAVEWSPDGAYLASAGDDHTVCVWSIIAKMNNVAIEKAATFEGHTNSPRLARWHPQEAVLASAGYDGTIRLWNTKKPSNIRLASGHGSYSAHIAWIPGTSQIAVGQSSGELKIWDSLTGRVSFSISAHASSISAVLWDDCASRIITTGGSVDDGSIRTWSLANGQQLANFDPNRGWIGSCDQRPGGNELVITAEMPDILIVNVAIGKEVARLKGHRTIVRSAAWSPSGDKLVSGGYDGLVILWDRNKEKEIAHGDHSGGVSCVAWDLHGEKIVSAGYDGVLRLWNVATMAEICCSEQCACAVDAIAWHPTIGHLAVALHDGRIFLWDPATNISKYYFSKHDGAISEIAWSPDGLRLASAGQDGTVRFWNASSGALLCAFESAGDGILARTSGGFCVFGSDVSRYRLTLRRPEADSRTVLYLPLAGLRDVLHRPDKVESALAGDLSGDDLSSELACLGWNNGVSWDGETHRFPSRPSDSPLCAFSVPAPPFEGISPTPPKTPSMTTQRFPRPLLNAYRNGKLALFVGSGLSLGADVEGDFPTWSQLPERLLDACVLYEALDENAVAAKRARFQTRMRLEDMLAELGTLRTALGRDYQSVLNDVFRPAHIAPGEVHRALIALGVHALLTTNYDQLLEMVPEAPRRQSYTWKEAALALGDLRAGRKVLLKVHGSAERHETVVLSEREYHEARADRSYQAVLSFLLQDHVFFFVGYGMNDPLDLDLALKGNEEALRTSAQRHYVLLRNPSDAERDRLEREFNVRAIPYADHAELPAILASLAVAMA